MTEPLTREQVQNLHPEIRYLPAGTRESVRDILSSHELLRERAEKAEKVCVLLKADGYATWGRVGEALAEWRESHE
jgi:hypothetical protein